MTVAPHPAALDYCFGAGGDEQTMCRNSSILDSYLLTPRMLPGTAKVRLATEVIGGEIAAPLLVAPMGLQGLLHPDAEAAVASAAGSVGLGFCLSTFSSRTPDEVVKAAGPGLRWFQLYLMRDGGVTSYLVETAARLGFAAIVCTLDVPVVGKRVRDLANEFDRFAIAPPALAFSEPVRRLAEGTSRSTREVIDLLFPHPDCTWDDLAALIATSPLPVLVKGVLHPADAQRALAIGAAGVVVSNHGGRQFDRSISSAEALPRIRAAVGDQVAVYLDSGIRTATHVAVALALGATAVLLGRPVLSALAEGGGEAVSSLLRTTLADLTHLAQILGVADARDFAQLDIHRAGQ